MDELPTPRTTTDELLVALTREVQGLRADLKAARGGEPTAPDADGRVLVTEPAPAGQTPRRPKTPRA